ncbi:hypothetical protein BE21_49345 [Sorangium cellulosum]|uniref:Uncharacterized protein n=1 Tax=Sorangium cellulosum TaxID=56 RepID=A0A150TGW6_SORCE|nr:hypothetical protein BE21_49345 [Sorangium cellulosum]
MRRAALRDLAALPGDAWERRVAMPWLVRLSFEVPEQLLPGLPSEERDFVMETREWFEQFTARKVEAGVEAALKEAVKEAVKEAKKEAKKEAEEAKKEAEQRARLRLTAQMCELRLGRPLAEAEIAALGERLARLQETRVAEVLLSFSAEALATWLADPNAT